ncbi:hypothetical protein AOC36_00785 [Erysipelothrix larvae]|uniref:ABC transporter ATP-binding protein n=1 Tax=Erysipelothrix larvae TaxID=1514105 RepID=A0A0X8GYJ6_9FIRM|nr:ABC transporter ATP-binding protein [Erysipelothrix larvae]AMC92579.1 hypothetical protein AOC36_00785 [Erysipelothrix larvae]
MKSVRFGDKKQLTYLVLALTIGALIQGWVTFLLGDIVDYGYAGNLDGMLSLIPQFLIVVVLNFGNSMVQLSVKTNYIKQSMMLLKNTYIDKLMQKDITQLQKEFTPIYRSQLTQDMDRYEGKFFDQISMLVLLMSNALVSLYILFTVNVWVGVGSTALMLVFGAISARSGKPLQKSETKKTESLNNYTSFVEESLEGFEVIKQHQLETSRKKMFFDYASKVQEDNYNLDVKSTYIDALNQTLQMIVFFIAICGGLWFANQAGATIGAVIMVIMAFSNIVWPMQQIVPTLTQMMSIQDVIRTFDERLKNEVVNRPETVESYESFDFIDTDLGYDTPILHDVNIELGHDDKVLIVGPSGAGKSTILKTMRQSIKPLIGEVLMNDMGIYEIDAMSYYKNFATVDQVGYIFNGTLKENVTLHQAISDDKIHEALKQVRLDDLDLNMELINNGANLSGGQRARLLSARALCLDCSIIVCDEIFAALDGYVAQEIEHDLLKLDQAIVNVSHIYFEENLDLYDAIYRVDNGQVKRVTDTQTLVDSMLKAA